MINDESPLVRLPKEMGSKQRLFLDGIRHAAEIAGCAHGKLSELLTRLAAARDDGGEHASNYAEVFLYAWAFIDAADRFRALMRLLPGMCGDKEALNRLLAGVFADTRELRNAADHIASKADYYVAQNAPALGTLSWLTRVGADSVASCAIRPGTTPQTPRVRMLALGADPPQDGSSNIHLEVGKIRVCLCHVLAVMRAHVEGLESLLSEAFRKSPIQFGSGMNRDALIVAMLKVVDESKRTGGPDAGR